MRDLEIRLKRELYHAMDNLEGLDPLQVGYQELTEGIKNLSEAMERIKSMQDYDDYEAQITEAEVPVAEVVELPKAEVKIEVVETEEVAEEVAEEAESEPCITKEELRAVLKDCSAIDKALLPELLAQVGASRLSEVKEEDYFKLYKLAKAKLGDE